MFLWELCFLEITAHVQSLWEGDLDVLLRLLIIENKNRFRCSFIFKSKSARPGGMIPRPLPFSAIRHTAPRVERSDRTLVSQGMKMLTKKFCCALCAYSYTIHAQRCLVVVLIPGSVTCSFLSKHTVLSYIHFSEHDKRGGGGGDLGQTQNSLEELHSSSGRGMLWDLPGGSGSRWWGEGCLEYPE